MVVIDVLEQQIKSINQRISEARCELAIQPESTAEDGESSVAIEQRMKADANLRFLVKQKQLFEQALRKAVSGDYGFCEDCGEDIGQKRLEKMPMATCCVSCQTEREMKSRHFAA